MQGRNLLIRRRSVADLGGRRGVLLLFGRETAIIEATSTQIDSVAYWLSGRDTHLLICLDCPASVVVSSKVNSQQSERGSWGSTIF